jgi:xylulokinase
MDYLLGIDLGSSSVKASILEASSGECLASSFYPESELKIDAPHPGFAEQDPNSWYNSACKAVGTAIHKAQIQTSSIKGIGISYQMHGLVCVDRKLQVLRPAIIWCDSRAVEYGQKAFESIGSEICLHSLLNSPGNFTASKLAWVKEHEPEIYERIFKIMLPGDWLAMKLSGEVSTTISGLSEGIFWDFAREQISDIVLDYFNFDRDLIPDLVPSFGKQGLLNAQAALDFGLTEGTPITYRGGDQPNNALSLNVLNPGEIAATGGTSGVIYGVADSKKYDEKSRVNSFIHLNHTQEQTRLGILLCINACGILNAWTKKLLGNKSYEDMNQMAKSVPVGSNGLSILPFGNGAERILENRNIGAQIYGLDLNRHGSQELCRAVQEGIVFSFIYGIEILQQLGINLQTIKAGMANMFLSDIFCSTLANCSGAKIELYKTDGALGAARGAGIGAGIYRSFAEAFDQLTKVNVIEPIQDNSHAAYERWKMYLQKGLE